MYLPAHPSIRPSESRNAAPAATVWIRMTLRLMGDGLLSEPFVRPPGTLSKVIFYLTSVSEWDKTYSTYARDW